MPMHHNMSKSNPSFIILLNRIQKVIPNVMFLWILATYLFTAIISIYFIPLTLWITIPISFMIQGSRFLVVFMNFLNPGLSKSKIPAKIALFATLLALSELFFALSNRNATLTENSAIFLFFASIILFGYFLEIHFIQNGEMVFSMEETMLPEVKKNGMHQPFQNHIESV